MVLKAVEVTQTYERTMSTPTPGLVASASVRLKPEVYMDCEATLLQFLLSP